MPYADRNGVRFFYTEAGAGDPPLLFVHGWCCDSSHWRRQLPAFRRKHRVVAVDLRGHGRSGKPQQDYTMDAFAEDLEWLIGELELQRPVVIGHSMGGVIALRLAGRRKRALSGVVIVDSPIFPKFDRPGRQQLYAFFRALDGPMFRAAARQVIEENLFIPASPPELRKRITEGMLKTRQHVVSSAFRHMWGDNMALAKRVNVPSLFVDVDRDLEELKRIQRAVKGIKIGRTVGAGHFNMLETPDQFNAMLRTFLDQLGSGRA